MKKIFAIFLLVNLLSNCAFADTIWADDSINDEIKVKYNTNAIEDDLIPPLPAILNTPSTPAPNYQQQNQSYKPQPQQTTVVRPKPSSNYTYSVPVSNNPNNRVQLKAGTKFRLRLDTAISDMSIVGSKVYLTSQYPETNRYITIPAGSRFVGSIKDAHYPQLSGNGGLIVVDVNELQYKGRTYPIKSTVLMAGNKRIFLNNIKGKRKYFKSMVSSTKFGRKFYSKSWQLTKRYAGEGLEVVLTPVTFIGGAAVLAGNVMLSPAVALFSRGGNVSVPAGSRLDIKLLEDTMISF